jgi:hypothetical protein
MKLSKTLKVRKARPLLVRPDILGVLLVPGLLLVSLPVSLEVSLEPLITLQGILTLIDECFGKNTSIVSRSIFLMRCRVLKTGPSEKYDRALPVLVVDGSLKAKHSPTSRFQPPQLDLKGVGYPRICSGRPREGGDVTGSRSPIPASVSYLYWLMKGVWRPSLFATPDSIPRPVRGFTEAGKRLYRGR